MLLKKEEYLIFYFQKLRIKLYEAFACGTAVTIGPINKLCYNFKEYKIPIVKELNAGKLSSELSNAIFNIQVIFKYIYQIFNIKYGKIDHPWSVVV